MVLFYTFFCLNLYLMLIFNLKLLHIDTFKDKDIKYPKNCTDEQKAKIRKDKFYEWAISIEKEKLYYFTLIFIMLYKVFAKYS